MTLPLLLGAAVLLPLLVTAAVTLGRVRRLHRLHQRLDAARAALDAALVQRARAARAAGLGEPADVALVHAGRPWDAAREDAENALGAALARTRRSPPPELVDAEQLAALLRAVHNDAVRDALALRTRRLVRWLRLAGTAPMPVYAEFTTPRFPTPDPAAGGPRGR